MWQLRHHHVDLNDRSAVIIIGAGVCTGAEAENLRTAIWLRGKYPNAPIIARTNQACSFAKELGKEDDITSFSMTELIEGNIPDNWLAMDETA